MIDRPAPRWRRAGVTSAAVSLLFLATVAGSVLLDEGSYAALRTEELSRYLPAGPLDMRQIEILAYSGDWHEAEGILRPLYPDPLGEAFVLGRLRPLAKYDASTPAEAIAAALIALL